jgi:hypothetical protein
MCLAAAKGAFCARTPVTSCDAPGSTICADGGLVACVAVPDGGAVVAVDTTGTAVSAPPAVDAGRCPP